MPNLFLSYLPVYIILPITLVLAVIIANLSFYLIEYLPLHIYSNLNIKSLTSFRLDKKTKIFFTLITAITFVAAGFKSISLIELSAYLIFISAILNIIVIDYKTTLIPDEITLPLVWIGLLFNIHGIIANSLQSAVYGAVIGYLILWIVYWLFKLIMKKEGMGYGDFKFLSAILAFLGVEYLIPMLLLSSILGIIYYIAMNGYNKFAKNPINFQEEGAIPFGPYLGISAILLLFLGHLFTL